VTVVAVAVAVVVVLFVLLPVVASPTGDCGRKSLCFSSTRKADFPVGEKGGGGSRGNSLEKKLRSSEMGFTAF